MKKILITCVAIIIGLFIIGKVIKITNDVTDQAEKATHLEDATLVYEEYQILYNACVEINIDLGNLRLLPKDDIMFSQFSKQQRIYNLRARLVKHVEDYNSKSKMWGRSLWKSDKLPYQLNLNQFNNYNSKK